MLVVGSAAELAAAEKINPSYVSRIMRLALLAPDIAEAIDRRRQADGVETDVLLRPFSPNRSKQTTVSCMKPDGDGRRLPRLSLQDGAHQSAVRSLYPNPVSVTTKLG